MSRTDLGIRQDKDRNFLAGKTVTYPIEFPSGQPLKRWTFGSIVVYAANSFDARQAYERIIEGGSFEAFGTVTLENGLQLNWVDLSRK